MMERNFMYRWLISVIIFSVFLSNIWGCALSTKKLLIKDISKKFDVGTIISTDTGEPVSYEYFVNDLKGVQVIYVGERHNEPSHHNIQLKLIKEIFKANQYISVGMEAFDRSYQQILYLWSDGELSEEKFMEKMHWYANWKFDFELYKEILLFIKDNKIRLVGLNLPFHIPSKIAIGGIESLSDDDKKHLPKEIDTSDSDHKAYLEKIFEKHKVKGREKFDNFYMAQCVWEEIMAESISQNLKGNPMIVIIGNGHIIHKFGVPDRAFRRTGALFKTIFLAPAGSEAELSFADYIWVTSSSKKRRHHMGGHSPHGHR
jgi:uncharacterized iron-regulated protein